MLKYVKKEWKLLVTFMFLLVIFLTTELYACTAEAGCVMITKDDGRVCQVCRQGDVKWEFC